MTMTKEEFDAMLTDIEKQAEWANSEIKRLLADNRRLQAENMELRLRNDNLTYYLQRQRQLN